MACPSQLLVCKHKRSSQHALLLKPCRSSRSLKPCMAPSSMMVGSAGVLHGMLQKTSSCTWQSHAPQSRHHLLAAMAQRTAAMAAAAARQQRRLGRGGVWQQQWRIGASSTQVGPGACVRTQVKLQIELQVDLLAVCWRNKAGQPSRNLELPVIYGQTSSGVVPVHLFARHLVHRAPGLAQQCTAHAAQPASPPVGGPTSCG